MPYVRSDRYPTYLTPKYGSTTLGYRTCTYCTPKMTIMLYMFIQPVTLFAGLLMSHAEAAALKDLNENCNVWAAGGECELNPNFMRKNCALACSAKSPELSQIERECVGYAEQGECVRNPAFMIQTCRRHCDAWEKAHGFKIDRHSSCVELSLLGRCETPDEFMIKNCNTSCTINQRCSGSSFSGWSIGICDKALRCEAEDKKSSCATWASQGKCRTDAQNMAVNCLSSCAASDVDAVLSAQRPEMRARISKWYDVATSYARRQERCWLPGWEGHNSYKLMLPTQCSAPVRNAWVARRYPRTRRLSREEDAMLCPLDVSRTTPRVPWRSRNVTILPHTPHPVRVQQARPRSAHPPALACTEHNPRARRSSKEGRTPHPTTCGRCSHHLECGCSMTSSHRRKPMRSCGSAMPTSRAPRFALSRPTGAHPLLPRWATLSVGQSSPSVNESLPSLDMKTTCSSLSK